MMSSRTQTSLALTVVQEDPSTQLMVEQGATQMLTLHTSPALHRFAPSQVSSTSVQTAPSPDS